jgi:hypothetical protein
MQSWRARQTDYANICILSERKFGEAYLDQQSE